MSNHLPPGNARSLLALLAVWMFGFVTAYILRSYFYLDAFAVLCFCLTGLFVCIGLLSKRRRLVGYNAAAIVAAIGLFEFYVNAWPPAKAEHEGTYATGGYFREDPELGYAISPGKRVVTSIEKSADGSMIYDAKYSINQYGLRQTEAPNTTSGNNGSAIFFFGDFFTFGEGVNDFDSLPQQFSDLSGFRTINFGVHGYGPHQVLRELEIGRSRMIDPRDPLAVVYTLLPSAHMARAAGRAPWDQTGPHYELVDGALKYLGRYNGNGLPSWEKAAPSLSRISRGS